MRTSASVSTWVGAPLLGGVAVLDATVTSATFVTQSGTPDPLCQRIFEPGLKELQVKHLGGPWYSYSYVL